MELKYQLLFILNFLVCFFLMKAASWLVTPWQKRPAFTTFLFGWPYLSTRSLRVVANASSASPILSFCLQASATFVIIALARFYLSPITYLDRILLGVAVYFLTEALGSLGQLLFVWRKETISPIHHRPLSSPSLSEFWGRRWNLWVQDWIADLGRPFHRKHKQKIIASFLLSGLFHEAMVNLPYWLYTGESYFGTMLAYFFIQAMGLYIDKKFFRHSYPHLRRLFCWLVVILPAPLFIHMPLLSFFGMTE
jgi:hypothetical protein